MDSNLCHPRNSATPPLVRVERLCKDFPGGRVLADINLELRAGEIVGVIGENGAGKSTFAKILSGIYQPSSGRILLDGQPARFPSPAHARRAGITLVPQEFDLIPELRVFENVFLGRESRRHGLLDRRTMIDRTRSVLARLDPAIAPEAPVASLTAAQRQAVEIAKGLAHACRLLILDEPTAVLAGHEAERLLAQARRLRDDGVTILFVSHRLREVRALCDRVLILRDGRTVGLEPAAELDERALAARMVGREPADVFPPRGVPSDNVCLRVEGLTARRGPPRGATFEVRAGEILGLAGLAGSGRTEVTEILAGVRPARAGRVVVDGVACPLGSPQASLRRGLAILPEDRLGAGVLAGFDVAANVTLASLSRYAAPFLDRCAIRERAERYIREFDIRCRGSDQRVGQLSGGNQQKVSLAKSLDPGPRVLLASEPTAGVDVGAKRELYAFLRDLTRQGLACLLSSSDLEEIIGLSDRVAVMRDGRVAAVLEGADVTEKTIILHATGLARDTNDN